MTVQKLLLLTNLIGLVTLLLLGIGYGDIDIGTHIYVLAGALALVGFILGFTH